MAEFLRYFTLYAVVIESELPQEAEIADGKRKGSNQASWTEVKHGDSSMSATACNSSPPTEMARIIPRIENPLRVMTYFRLEGLQGNFIGIISSRYSSYRGSGTGKWCNMDEYDAKK